MARPSGYNETLAAAICERIAGGESLRAVCADAGMPGKATVMEWLVARETFARAMAAARTAQADGYADEIVEIADGCDNPAQAKVRIDARKWAAAKLAPKKYGMLRQKVGDLERQIGGLASSDRVAGVEARLAEVETDLRDARDALAVIPVISEQIKGFEKLMGVQMDEVRHGVRNLRTQIEAFAPRTPRKPPA